MNYTLVQLLQKRLTKTKGGKIKTSPKLSNPLYRIEANNDIATQIMIMFPTS